MRNSYHTFKLLLSRNGKDLVCLVDQTSLPLIAERAWSVNAQGYAVGTIKGSPGLLMHRLVARAKTGETVDHLNRDKLDNRSCNLRIATNRQNSLNHPVRRDNKLGLRGVTITAEGRFRANITVNKKTHWLGSFDTKEQAAKAYNDAAIRFNGSDAQLNE